MREMLEMHGLTGKWADARGHEHQPGEHLGERRRRLLRQELAGLLGEIKQDGVAVENGYPVIDDDWHFAIRIDGKKGRVELLALARVDGNRLIGQFRFLKEQSDLGWIRRSVEIKL